MKTVNTKYSIFKWEKTRILINLGPAVFFLAIFLFFPLLALVRVSFMEYDPVRIKVAGSFTFQNYIHVLSDPYYIKTILKTLGYGVATVFVTMVLGYPMAYFLARTKLRIKKYLLSVMLLPLTLSVVVIGFGWFVILGIDGIVDKLVSLILAKEHVKLLFNPYVVIIALSQIYLPYQVFCLTNSFSRIDPVLEDAAHNLGANGIQNFIRILLPLTMPGLIAGSTFVGIGTITAFIVPKLLGGIGISMLGPIIYEQTLGLSLNWPLGATFSIILFILTFIIFWFFTEILLKRVKSGYHIKG
jgi:putative spermidine/putrescine transport system permease protein